MKDDRLLRLIASILLLSFCAPIAGCGRKPDDSQSDESSEITYTQLEMVN